MRKTITLFSAAALSLGTMISYGQAIFADGVSQQHFCGTDDAIKRSLDEHPEYLKQVDELERFTQEWIKNNDTYANANKSGTILYTIPVVFHILHDDGPENIAKKNVIDEMRILNEDYQKLNTDISQIVSAFQGITADVQVKFVLASKDPNGNCTDGIERIKTTATHAGTLESQAPKYNWSPSKYMNVYVVEKINIGAPAGGGVVAGYTFRPGTTSSSNDAIMIAYNYVGALPPSNYQAGRTLTHESGHWFNLSHCWGDSNEPGVACGNDGVTDTPTTKGWSTCDINGATCGNTVDNVQNYMEYSFCSKMFTNGQKSRMHAALNSSTAGRNNLWKASNLTATGVDNPTPPPCIPVADFSSDKQVACTGSPITFYDGSWKADPTSYNWTFTGGTPSTSTDASPSVTYSTPGTYSVTLSSGTSAGNSTPVTKTSYITVKSATAKYSLSSFGEDFQNATNVAADWEIVNPAGSVTFAHTTTAGYNSSSCMKLNNSSNTAGATEAIISSGVNIKNIYKPGFTFYSAYAQKSAKSDDVLKVLYSPDCGFTWVPRKTFASKILPASGLGYKTSAWTPSSASDWVKQTVSLGGATSAENVLIKFEFVSGDSSQKVGNNLYIDDINIVPTGIYEKLADEYNFFVSPNPISGSSVVYFDVFDRSVASVKLLDIVGKEVRTIVSQRELSPGVYQYPMSEIAELPAGIYFIQLNISGITMTEKVVIQ